MSLVIQQSDFLSTVQDLGRFGYQHVGVSTGGPMDEHAFLWNNHLLGNTPQTAQIEITMGGFKCIFHQPTMAALAGADMQAKLNGQAITPWQSFYVHTGDILELGLMQHGVYSYLAVKGGFNVTPVLNSTATVTRDALGGLTGQGHKLAQGDILKYPPNTPQQAVRIPKRYIPEYQKEIRLGVIPTAQYTDFSPEMQQKFFNTPYKLTQNISRMGFRLSGEAILSNKPNLYSEGVGLGAVQIPADGQPIILMRDHQTIGGYPKIGYVCRTDLNLLAQSAPNTIIRFYKKDITKAGRELKEFTDFFMK